MQEHATGDLDPRTDILVQFERKLATHVLNRVVINTAQHVVEVSVRGVNFTARW